MQAKDSRATSSDLGWAKRGITKEHKESCEGDRYNHCWLC